MQRFDKKNCEFIIIMLIIVVRAFKRVDNTIKLSSSLYNIYQTYIIMDPIVDLQFKSYIIISTEFKFDEFLLATLT